MSKRKEEIGWFFRDHPHPAVWISVSMRILAANDAAVQMFGDPREDTLCYQYLYGRNTPCPLCAAPHAPPALPSPVITRRCRVVKNRHGDEVEMYATSILRMESGKPTGRTEQFGPLPRMRVATRAIMGFADRIEQMNTHEEVLREYVDFISTEKDFLQGRARLYKYGADQSAEKLVCVCHDELKSPYTYLPRLVGRVVQRRSGVNNVSFICLDEKRWFILTPDQRPLPEGTDTGTQHNQVSDVEAFVTHFKGEKRPKPGDEGDHEGADIYDSHRPAPSPALSLYHYHPRTDKIEQVFKELKHHVWLDIPIISHGHKYGKLSITLADNSLLFCREYLEELILVERFVSRRLAAIEALQAVKRGAIQNVMHEVAQPAFAGLASMEALRRRDRENGLSAKTEPIEYYLKKNVACSLQMVAFLNDRGRITEEVTSYSSAPSNLLRDILAGVVNLTRFQVYEKYLRDTADKVDERELEDVHVKVKRVAQERTQRIASHLGERTYSIEYDQECERITLFVEKYRLQQVFYNLLNNALKYKGLKNDFVVSVAYREYADQQHSAFKDYFVVDVMDSGVGIEKDETEVIFRLFKQGRQAREMARQRGSARGLYVCRAILRGFGGEILVWNRKNPTTFRLLFPRECEKLNWDNRVEELRARTRRIIQPFLKG